MPALQVRDFPAPLHEELKAYAAQNHRSIAQQTIIAVEAMLARVARSADSQQSSVRAGQVDEGSRAGWELDRESALGGSDRSLREARARRRERLFEEFDEIPWMGEALTVESIASLVREGRDALSERAWKTLDPFVLNDRLAGDETL